MNISNVFHNILETAENNSYSSFDVSDLQRTQFARFGSTIKNLKVKNIVMKPYDILIKNFPNQVRYFVKEKYFKYPQGIAMTIRGLISYYNYSNKDIYLQKAVSLGDWLLDNNSGEGNNLGWGQPFLWYSRKVFPANTARATVTSQVGWAFIDLYNSTKSDKYLDALLNIFNCFKYEFNYTRQDDGTFCLSYTTVDNYHIHNSNVLASSMLARSGNLLNNSEIIEFAKNATLFTLNHQNTDGSFYYWAPPNKLSFKIDNIHTGFVLESLETLKDDLPELKIDSAYLKGLNYYYHNLFEGCIPKFDNNKIYPVDIQSCAQALITFSNTEIKEYCLLANSILDFTLKKFYLSSKKHFGFRKISESSTIDESYYFRWGDSWMIKALPLYLN